MSRATPLPSNLATELLTGVELHGILAFTESDE